MVADILAPCVARSSAEMILTTRTLENQRRSLPYTRKDFNYLCLVSVEE